MLFSGVDIQCPEYGGLARRLPECERLSVTSCAHVVGKPQKLTFQVCLQTSELPMNAMTPYYTKPGDVMRSKPVSTRESIPT